MSLFAVALRLKQLASAPTPPSGASALYFKTDGKLYKKDSAGTEAELGAQGPQGPAGPTGPQGPAGADATALTAWPVGSIFLSTVSTNPATLLGGGTWVAWGTGRIPIGINSADTDFDVLEEVGGSKTHTLAAGNLPPHTHDISHGHNFNQTAATGSGASGARGQTGPTAISGPVVNFSGNSGDGSLQGLASTPVNHMPPYIVCRMWKRTA